MPKKLHRKLKRQASKLAREGKLRDRDAYVHGTMAKIKKRRRRKSRKPRK